MKKYIAAIVAFMSAIGIFWVSGMEFERGLNQALALYVAIPLSALAAFIVGWDD